MTGSVSFDRAADYYDQTRSLPDDVMAQLVPHLAAELPREGICLEIGIGTGRIALPLVDAGVRVVGADISTAMLRRLRAKTRGDWPQAVIADATRLPFPDHCMAAAVASHVLHLIPEWKAAVLELMRVLAPGGVLLASVTGDQPGPWQREVRRHFFVEAGDPPWPPGLDRIDTLDDEMTRLGVDVRALPELKSEHQMSINELLHALESGVWAACWGLDEPTRLGAAEATRSWARQRFSDLDAPRPAASGSVWHAYRLHE